LGRAALVVGASAAAAFTAYIWWPNGDYKPIQPGERGTVQGAVQEIGNIPSGRPALTPAQQQKLGGAPTKRSHTAPAAKQQPQQSTSTIATDTTQTATSPAQTTSTQPTASTPAATTDTTATVTTTATTVTTP
ncbi:MAG: hypothetical protein QOF50_583, partial [Gaiellaceae bacterium]|nr:hypothetical protein [Gaiellaceae bacterium]